MAHKSKYGDTILGKAIGIFILLVLSPFILVGVVLYFLSGFVLYLAIWIGWCLRGRYVLFVYSNSPIWSEYIEREILPRIEDSAVVLNWSERKRWKKSLAILAFRRFGSRRAFNPLAVVFRPLHFAKTFRFFEPFHEFKHGKPGKVEQMKAEFFDALVAVSKKANRITRR